MNDQLKEFAETARKLSDAVEKAGLSRTSIGRQLPGPEATEEAIENLLDLADGHNRTLSSDHLAAVRFAIAFMRTASSRMSGGRRREGM